KNLKLLFNFDKDELCIIFLFTDKCSRKCFQDIEYGSKANFKNALEYWNPYKMVGTFLITGPISITERWLVPSRIQSSFFLRFLTTIILLVPGIKRERTVIASQSRKDVVQVFVKEVKSPKRIRKKIQEDPVTAAMKHKMVTTLQFAFCLALICANGSMGKPLTAEDVEDLLPPAPRDKNETIAAVVQDPVVQDAVHHAVSNGSLNGLVVKKHVFIMPATNPTMILSKREHLLVVPTENLEDVRKNITAAKEAEAQESSSLESQAFFEGDASDYAPQDNESGLEEKENESFPEQNVAQSVPLNEKRKSGTEFLKDKLSDGTVLPEDSSSKTVAVPIVAVIDPSNAEKGKVKSPIVAILPNEVKNGQLNSQMEFLKDNSGKIQKEAQYFVDQSSLTVNPDYWKSSTPSEIIVASSPTYNSDPVSLATDGMLLSPVVVSQWAMLSPSLQNDQIDYSQEIPGDMDVAEDIVFRPLFKYRQESQQRSKYYDGSNRRYSYNSYYPRRPYFYRPSYDYY
ncbi:unnamed protein product, partial [Heterotrigona itama]